MRVEARRDLETIIGRARAWKQLRTEAVSGRINIGGRWWRCLSCGRSFAADCECCEPPACGCVKG